MHEGRLPPQRMIAPDPPDFLAAGIGQVAQPVHVQNSSGLEPYRVAPRIGMPRMSEATLIRAHRRCTCSNHEERLPWEDWSPGQWEWYRRRQRVMARRTIQLEERAARKGAA